MIRFLTLTLVLFGLVALLALAPANAHALDVIDQGVCSNAKAAQSAVCKDNKKEQADGDSNPVASLIGKISTIIAVVAGIVAVIMIIISGFKFVTSGGDSQKVAGARNTLLWSVVGLIVVALAATIISFIMSKI